MKSMDNFINITYHFRNNQTIGRKSPNKSPSPVSNDQISNSSGEKYHKHSPTGGGIGLTRNFSFRKTSRGEVEDKTVQRKPIKPFDQS